MYAIYCSFKVCSSSRRV
ncbi:unnamed protein product [Staurois parvus]|uniref:Uncharacterized protein n=1 Tax=Staurois parvus TaxID=386267 RepID=A0ABN9EBG2_9NEOB|nr:unnamed protein product [Staurois parvus]